MKNLLLIYFTALPFFIFSQDHNIKNGYVITFNGDTLIGDFIKINDKNVTIQQASDQKQWTKTDLKDYGYFKKDNSQFFSMYAHTIFDRPTHVGSYTIGFEEEVKVGYIKKWEGTTNTITCYHIDGTKEEYTTKEVKNFMIEKGGRQIWYDAIRKHLETNNTFDTEGDMYTISRNINEFSERIVDGKIRLNLCHMNERIRGRNTESIVYLFTKGYKTSFIRNEDGLLSLDALAVLNELFEDTPELLKEMHSKGYTYDKIPELILKYNTYFEMN